MNDETTKRIYTREQLIDAARAARSAMRTFEGMLIEGGRLPSDDAQFRQTIDNIEGWIGRIGADTAEHSKGADHAKPDPPRFNNRRHKDT